MLPCVGEFRITSKQGLRELPGREPKPHNGLDFVCADKRIRAAKSGVAVISGIITDRRNPSWAFGSRVWFRDLNGVIVENNHLDERYVKVGERIKEGDIIGYEGGTGDCYPVGASHLHFGVRNKLGAGYTALSAAKYLGIPNVVGFYNSEQFNPNKPEPEFIYMPFHHGTKVRVKAVSSNGNKKYGRTYTNVLFRLWHDVYNVIGDLDENKNTDRIVIGIGSTATAAVRAADLERVD